MDNYYVKQNPFDLVVDNVEPSFNESFKAAFGYQYSPIIARTQEELFFGSVERDPDFDPFDGIEQAYDGFEDDIARAKNPEHLEFIKQKLQENIDRRATLAESDFFSGALVAGLVDPLNIAFAIPVVGQLGMVKRGMSIGRAAAVAGSGGLAMQSTAELIRAPFDSLNTTGETAMNLLTTTAFSAVLGAGGSAVFNARGSYQRSAAKLRDLMKGEMGDEIDGTKINYVEKGDKMITTGKSGITVNQKQIDKEFNSRPWVKENIPANAFNTPREYQDFLINVEALKKEQKRKPGQSKDSYQTSINQQALDRTYEGYGLKKTLFTSSPFFKLIPSPGKTILLDPEVDDWIKRAYTLMEGNGAMALERNIAGKGVQSIRQRIPLHTVRARRAVEELRQVYNMERKGRAETRELAGVDLDNPTRTLGFKGDFGTFMEQKIDAYLRHGDPESVGRTKLSESDRNAFESIKVFFDEYLSAAQDVGLFRSVKNIDEHVVRVRGELDEVVEELEAKPTSKKLLEKQEDLNRQLKYYEGYKKHYSLAKRDYRFPIYYDKELLKGDTQKQAQLADIFERHIAKETHYYDADLEDWVKKPVDFNNRERAESIVARILDEDHDLFDPDIPRAGGGKHLKHRALDIPEHEVADFIIKDERVFHSYAQRMGRRIEWSRNFGRQSISGVLENIENSMRAKGASEKKIAKIKTAFFADYERVMGMHIRSPDRFDAQVAKFIKETSGITYLHQAGISSVTDAGMLVLERGFGRLLAPMIDKEKRQLFSMARNDIPKLVEGTQLLTPGIQQRVIGDSVQSLQPNMIERIFNPITSAYYNIPIIGNNLGSVTRYGKIVDATFRQSELIEMSVRVAKNDRKAGRDVEYLARYGIDIDTAKRIANLKGAWQKDSEGKFYYANIDAWPKRTRQDRELINTFTTALNSGTGNTIMHATSFDKPLLADGVLYVRHYPWMEKLTFGKLKPEPGVGTASYPMARLEAGAMAFPFQFMSFTMAATNRITGAMFDNNRRHRLAGALSLFALSYASLQFKKEDWWFESRSNDELVARVLDHSGLLGIYSDLYYMGLAGATGMGFLDQDTDYGFLKGKYKATAGDALFEPLGAGPGLVREWVLATQELMDGYTDDGKERLYYNAPSLPFLSLTGLNEDVKELWMKSDL
jgi:hypothetical protein